MESRIRELLGNDWGVVLISILSGVLILTFVGAPRAVSEMIGLASSAFGYRDYPYAPNAPWLLVAGVPVGLLARTWKNAAVGLIIACTAVFVAGPSLPADDEAQGLALVGIALFVAYSAGVVRWLIGQRELGKEARFGAATIFVLATLIGIFNPTRLLSLSRPAPADYVAVEANATEYDLQLEEPTPFDWGNGLSETAPLSPAPLPSASPTIADSAAWPEATTETQDEPAATNANNTIDGDWIDRMTRNPPNKALPTPSPDEEPDE